jgi:hypothetical protein
LYAFNSEPQNAYLILYTIALFIYDKATLELEFLRVCPKTSGGITKFSEHEAD